MQIAKYFATFGIKVDQKSLDRINTILKKLEGHVKKYHAKIDTLENKTTTAKIKNLDKVAKHQNQKMDSHVYLHKKHLEKVGKQEESAAKKRLAAISRIERSVKYWTPPVGRQAAANKATGFVYKQPSGYIKNASAWLPSQGSNMRSQFAEYYGRQAAAVHSQERRTQERLGASMAKDYNREFLDRQSAAKIRRNRINRAGELTSRYSTRAFKSGVIGSLPAFGILNSVSNSTMNAASDYYSIEGAVKAYGGKEDDAIALWNDLKKYSNNVGVQYSGLATPLAKITANLVPKNGGSFKDVFETFKTISGTAAGWHLTPDRTQRLFMGFTQMFSKGQVSFEELKNQISEHAPLSDLIENSYINMKASQGTTVDKKTALMTMMKEIKSTGISSFDYWKFLKPEMDSKLEGLLSTVELNPMTNMNRMYNKIAEGFDPFANPENKENIRMMYGDLANAAERLIPVFIKLGGVLSNGASAIAQKLGDYLGVDIYGAEKAQLRQGDFASLPASARLNPLDKVTLSQGATFGSTTVFTNPIAAKLYNEQVKYLSEDTDYFMRNYVDKRLWWSSSKERNAAFENPSIQSALERMKSDIRANTLPEEILKKGGYTEDQSKDSAAKSVTKSVVRKLPSEYLPKEGQGITFNGDIHVTTPNSESFTGDLLRKTMSFKGTERVA